MKFLGTEKSAAICLACGMVCLTATAAWAKPKLKQDSEQLRAAYLARVQQQPLPAPQPATSGSLWLPGSAFGDLAADYKARYLNDTVTILVVQQTTAQSTGDVNSQRSFQVNSAVTGAAGRANTGGLDPILAASSAHQLKGQGATTATSKVQTSLAGRVIAVLPNGNLVVEAQRQVAINNQREMMIVRGVLRPGDVSPTNTALSTSLSDLEVELKGKGVVSDAIRAPNPLIRALLWIVSF